ncbi:hypothetical protein D9M71_618760 [compost metagenome]
MNDDLGNGVLRFQHQHRRPFATRGHVGPAIDPVETGIEDGIEIRALGQDDAALAPAIGAGFQVLARRVIADRVLRVLLQAQGRHGGSAVAADGFRRRGITGDAFHGFRGIHQQARWIKVAAVPAGGPRTERRHPLTCTKARPRNNRSRRVVDQDLRDRVGSAND